VTPPSFRIATAALTDLGRKRSGNEDCYEVWTPEGRGGGGETLLVVCDGMGGSNAGEVASRMAADAVVRGYAERRARDPGEALKEAVETANHEVWEHTRTRPDLEGMGTTCTALVLRDGAAALAHVGDSRAYLVRSGRIRQLTQDHSLVAQLVARHQLTPEEAKKDPRRNVVTRSVGVQPTVEVDMVGLGEEVRPGDTFLLCSDGLHGQVSEHEMARAAAVEHLDRACRELVALANQRGGPDNITVLLARVEAVEAVESATRAPRRAGARRPASVSAARRRLLTLLIAALITLLIVLCGVVWVVFGMIRSTHQAHAAPASAGEANR
jgi:protein phosphatase